MNPGSMLAGRQPAFVQRRELDQVGGFERAHGATGMASSASSLAKDMMANSPPATHPRHALAGLLPESWTEPSISATGGSAEKKSNK